MSIVYDAQAKDWKPREERQPRRQRPAPQPSLFDGVGNTVSSLPHVTNEGDWARFFARACVIAKQSAEACSRARAPAASTARPSPTSCPRSCTGLVIRRSLPADEKAWSKACPRPAGWDS
jgi:hypothetical protein